MAYNPRMSTARNTSYQQRAPAPTESDAFMTLVCVSVLRLLLVCPNAEEGSPMPKSPDV